MINNDDTARIPVITLDGPSGTGKGTICLMLAHKLQWHVLDSGAIYRVLAYAARKNHLQLTDVSALAQLAENLNLRFGNDGLAYLDNINISAEIRSEQCGQDASTVAVIPEVRQALLDKQRAFAMHPGLVTDGRDMGTVIFPDAALKIYLHASAEERAKRRYAQLQKGGNDVSLAQVIEELSKRDARDTSRTCAPLKPASDAVMIDTTNLTITQAFDEVLTLSMSIIDGGR